MKIVIVTESNSVEVSEETLCNDLKKVLITQLDKNSKTYIAEEEIKALVEQCDLFFKSLIAQREQYYATVDTQGAPNLYFGRALHDIRQLTNFIDKYNKILSYLSKNAHTSTRKLVKRYIGLKLKA